MPRLHIEDAILRDEQGREVGRLASIVIDLYAEGGLGGLVSSSGDLESKRTEKPETKKPPKSSKKKERPNDLSQNAEIGPSAGEEVVVTGGGGEVALPGLDEGLRLFEEWLRIFERDPSKLKYSPSRQRAAKRALAEADLATLVTALEGARRYRQLERPGSEEFTDIFGTFRGTGDLASRISFFVECAERLSAGSGHDAILAGIPSAQRDMVRERQRHVEAWLLNPTDEGLRAPGELAREWLEQTVGLVPLAVGEEYPPPNVVWRRVPREIPF